VKTAGKAAIKFFLQQKEEPLAGAFSMQKKRRAPSWGFFNAKKKRPLKKGRL
tara:strand:- start:307 stop:462 length:156 start_codon:yes stop_codon:yes gene_type:complete